MRLLAPLSHAVCILLCLPALALGQWSGEERDIDGVPNVFNPAAPILPPLTVGLQEQWRLGGFDAGEDEFFGVIGDVMVDAQNNFYVLDSQLSEVKVYDPSGAWLRTIGREGEGPGEFRRPVDLVAMPGGTIGVIQPWPSKMVLLTSQGDPAGDFSFAPQGEGFAGLMAASPVGDQLAIVYAMSMPDQKKREFRRVLRLGVFDTGGTETAQLMTASTAMQFGNQNIVEREWNHFDQAWAASPDGRIFARARFDAYAINVFGSDGTLERVIHRDYAPFARSSAEMDQIEARWAARVARWVPDPEFDLEAHWNPVQDLFAREDGTLWVRSSRGARDRPANVMAEFDVFDEQGRFERQVQLPGAFDPDQDGLFLLGGYAVVVTDLMSARDALMGGMAETESDVEPEPMQIICYRMDLSVLARAQDRGR